MLAIQELGDDGALVYHNAALKNTKQPVTVGDAAAIVYGWTFDNLDAAVAYLQFWDADSGDVTVGTTPPTLTVKIASSATRDKEFRKPIKFRKAITVAVTANADGSGSAPTNGGLLNLFYFTKAGA